MRNLKVLLCATLFMAVLACAMLTVSGPTTATADEKVIAGSHWRNHDGHWSYWHEGDQRWYYTDGSHWFFNDGKAWVIYKFDKGFGKEGFVKGEYKVPGEEVKIEVPKHGVFHVERK